MENITIKYCFTLEDDTQEAFDLDLGAENYELLGVVPDDLPTWAHLDFHQCPNCTLDGSTHPNCPLALHLVDIVRRLGRMLSYEKIHVEVITKRRRVSQHTTAQKGISSLMGVLIAASGCPHTVFFKSHGTFPSALC